MRPPLFLPPLLRPPLFLPEERLLEPELLEEDFRPPLLRREDDDLRPPRPDDFLPPDDERERLELFLLELFLLERLRPPLERPPPLLLLRALLLRPPLLRPEDPDRDLFLPPRELLDFLAAAIGMLRVGGFVRTDSKIRAQQRVGVRDDGALHALALPNNARLAELHDPQLPFVELAAAP